MLKGFPCKVNEYSTAKPGKHGSSKATIVGNDIFTGKKYEDSCPTSHNMQVPIVNKLELEVADISEDNFVSFILETGELKEDLKLPVEDQEVYQELKKLWDDNNAKGQVYFTIISAVKQ
jgi:translation elongation factor IF5A